MYEVENPAAKKMNFQKGSLASCSVPEEFLDKSCSNSSKVNEASIDLFGIVSLIHSVLGIRKGV